MNLFIANDFEVAGGAEIVFQQHLVNLKSSAYQVKKIIFKGSNPLVGFFSTFISCLHLLFFAVSQKKVIVIVYNFSSFSGIFFVITLYLSSFLSKKIKSINSAHDYYLLFPSREGLAFDAKGVQVNIYEKMIKNPQFDQVKLFHLIKKIRFLIVKSLVKSGRVFTHLVSPSTHLSIKLRKAYQGLRVSVIRNPVAERSRSSFYSEPRARYLIVGRLTESKGAEISFDYWIRYIANGDLCVIGAGPLEMKLKSLVKDLPTYLQNKIHFFGWLPREEVLKYMAGATILFSSKWTENAPMVFIEAAYMGAKINVLNRTACVREFQRLLPFVFTGDNSSAIKYESRYEFFSMGRFSSKWERALYKLSS
jgi:glycosyltransferase involved in cell wall biosynthesis